MVSYELSETKQANWFCFGQLVDLFIVMQLKTKHAFICFVLLAYVRLYWWRFYEQSIIFTFTSVPTNHSVRVFHLCRTRCIWLAIVVKFFLDYEAFWSRSEVMIEKKIHHTLHVTDAYIGIYYCETWMDSSCYFDFTLHFVDAWHSAKSVTDTWHK